MYFINFENLYSPRIHGSKSNRNNNYSTDKKRWKLDSNLDMRWAHSTVGIKKSQYKSQAAQSRCTVVRPIQKSIGKWEIRPPVKS